MPRFRRQFFVLVLVLYLATWVGGWKSHAEQMKETAEAKYKAIELSNQQLAEEDREFGIQQRPIPLHSRPHWGVSWCVPLLPGVLLTDSYFSVSPMGGRGGVKVVIYYGFNSTELCMLWGWIA